MLLSSIYPLQGPVNQGTKVCHFFAKEWVAAGHSVVAVHFQAIYPAPFYWVASLFQKKLAARTGSIVYTKRETVATQFKMDNVDVFRIPLYKPYPHARFTQKGIKKAVDIIKKHLSSIEFTPDIMVGHFLNPQLEILGILKSEYKYAKTGLVLHLPAELNMAEKLYGANFIEMIGEMDAVGFRNIPLQRMFESRYKIQSHKFICYSGIPEEFVSKKNTHSFNGKLNKFIFVGGLIERKYPAQILYALNDCYPEKDFNIKYVGAGQQEDTIKKISSLYNLSSQVELLGKINRDEIVNMYDNADCMIMISKGEAYGLVYLEAMARGCITIASRDEGMDGVIIHGKNGFLCKAGDSVELAQLIKEINLLSQDEKIAISNNAIATAKRLTDKTVAKSYLDSIYS